MFSLRFEQPHDAPAVEALLDRCFGPDRRHKTSYRYRDGVPPRGDLCHVAEDVEGGLLGAIRYWPVRLDDAPALLLGPLAIEPALQGRGIGRALVFHTLDKVKEGSAGPVFLVGEQAYYARFGFEPAPGGIVMPNEQPHRLQVIHRGGATLPKGGVLRPLAPATIALNGGIRYTQSVGA